MPPQSMYHLEEIPQKKENGFAFPANFEQKTGFETIRQLIADQCVSRLGRLLCEHMQVSLVLPHIEALLAQTDEFCQILRLQEPFPGDHYPDDHQSIRKARVEGTYLTEAELFDFRRSFNTVKEVSRFFQSHEREEMYPALSSLAQGLKFFPMLAERIDAVLGKNGKIKDNASPELADISRQISAQEAQVSKILHQILKKGQQEGWIEPDASLSVREGKLLIPVAAGNKRKIKGIVADESATGKTAFIEPYESIEMNNRIRELYFARQREIIRILVQTTDEIRPYADELMAAFDTLGEYDFIRAKARFSLTINAVKPRITHEATLDLRRAVHPLLYLALSKEGKRVVPLDIELNDQNRIVVISGPNAGGKSVCLKTVGLLQYMLQCGLPVPASGNSAFGIFHHVFLNIGDEQSIENDLSTYSSHLKSLRHFLAHADSRTMILIDEFGAGTEPLAGGAIAEAVLLGLNRCLAKGIVTTHYGNLKEVAANTPGLQNAAMLFDTARLEPLYQLEVGHPGSSFAFEIAAKIGLPEEILRYAENSTGREYLDFEKQLREVEDQKYRLDKEAVAVLRKQQQLDQLLEKYAKETEFTVEQRKSILKAAQREAKALLEDTNRRIENTIAEIRREQADKEQAKQARREIEQYKEKMNADMDEKVGKLEKHLDFAKSVKVRHTSGPVKTGGRTVADENPKPLGPGCIVRIKGQTALLEIVSLRQGQAVVASGPISMRVPIETLEQVSAKEARRIERATASKNAGNWDASQAKLAFRPGLDIRGLRVDEALDKLSKYIDTAIVALAHEVRILHGTGNGILRQAIRDYLRTVDVVRSVRDEHVELGGAGITVVVFDYD